MIDKKFIKFLLVGCLNTLFGYLMYIIFISTPLKKEIALFFAYIFGVLWNFKTTGVLVFKNNNNKLIFKFILAYVITYFINLFGLNLVHSFRWGENLANWTLNILNIQTKLDLVKYFDQIILILPIAMISFILFKTFVFKESEEICS